MPANMLDTADLALSISPSATMTGRCPIICPQLPEPMPAIMLRTGPRILLLIHAPGSAKKSANWSRMPPPEEAPPMPGMAWPSMSLVQPSSL